jgi:hypothetical protein
MGIIEDVYHPQPTTCARKHRGKNTYHPKVRGQIA